MALGIPEFRLVRPEKYLKFGPEISSSHWMQLFNVPSSLLRGSFVIQAIMQGSKHFDRVFFMLNCQIFEHSSEKPIFFKQLKTCCWPRKSKKLLVFIKISGANFWFTKLAPLCYKDLIMHSSLMHRVNTYQNHVYIPLFTISNCSQK